MNRNVVPDTMRSRGVCGPVISGPSEVGMLLQSQDIGVRVPVAPRRERALHKGHQQLCESAASGAQLQ